MKAALPRHVRYGYVLPKPCDWLRSYAFLRHSLKKYGACRKSEAFNHCAWLDRYRGRNFSMRLITH